MSFALPGCRSNFSLLWGTAFPAQLIEAAGRQGIEHLGLADHDNLYGATDWYFGCREAGINPILGTRLTTDFGRLHLIARSHAGYRNLCRLVTQYQLHDEVTAGHLSSYAKDVTCLTSDATVLASLKEIFAGDLYLSLHTDDNFEAQAAAGRLGIKPVANPGVSFIDKDDYSLHLLLRAIDDGALVSNLNGTPRDAPDACFPDIEIMKRRFRNCPQAVANGLALADSCRVIFPEHRNLLPDFPDYDGDKAEHLRAKALEGLRRKKGAVTGPYLARLEFELAVINRMDFTDYFLIVSGIVDHCHTAGIPVVGRGSAGGSLVSYALGITQVDPIRETLYFERFLNEARSDPPDIDLDIDWRRRDDVLEYVYDRYGHDRTAMIATYTRMRSRMAVRETAKAKGLATEEINRLVKELPRFSPEGINAEVRARAGGYADVWADAVRLHEFPRHLGIHPGGIVITPGPITDYVALERATKGLVVTQCDMYQAEKLGLIKIDILGQRGQAVIVDCCEHAKRIEGDEFTIPDGDPATLKLLQSGKTIGVFQIESPGLRSLLRDLKPTELNDLTLALALIRPGASDSGMKQDFLDCHHGKKTAVFPDERLRDILAETHGVFIYQEQVLLCARAIAGFNLPAADMLRRAMTKARKSGAYKRLSHRFLDGAIQNGLPREKAVEIFKLLSLFAGFGFCKAHAATYGYLAYQSAYLKTHFPARFMQAVLNNDGGYYPAAVYIAEARRLGVTIRPPDINKSDRLETVCGEVMYVGLERIRGLGQETIEQILARRPFASFDDFVEKVRLSAQEVENLIKVGAFDAIDTGRPCLLWRLRLRRAKRQPVGASAMVRVADDGDIFSGQLIVPRAGYLPTLPDPTPLEIFLYERELLGFSAGTHPLSMIPSYDGVRFADLAAQPERRAVIHAWLTDIKRIKTRERREAMAFLTFDDPGDTFEVVLFPEILRKYKALVNRFRYLRIEGTLNVEEGNTAIIADRISPAPTGLAEKPYL